MRYSIIYYGYIIPCKQRVQRRKKTKERIQDLLELITILDVTNKDIQDAIRSEWKDFEDSLQYIVALHNSVDAIITRNTKDFSESSIPIYSPKEFPESVKLFL